jgi:predicted SprT family Zn-dependent metalloprotease
MPELPSGRDAGLTAWCVRTAQRLGLGTLARRVEVRWNPRMRTTAGRASWPDRLIELNPRLAALTGEMPRHADPVSRTLRHELAHLVAYERARRRPIRPHGSEWAQACIELGIPGEPACHLLPFPRRRQKRRYHYTCPACARMLKRVKPVKGSIACYNCCRKLAHGKFDKRFQLVETRIE